MRLDNGFKLLKKQDIPEITSTALVYEHAATGGRLLSLVNQDENKVFGISFRTPPTDSTGLPHILEHSVLCGSRRYPVKEPFVELLKGSLQTFLNALTFPDKTCYPVASANEQDFRNLVDVYLDAVFYPRLTENVLRQEGWHYELTSLKSDLTRKGVVLGEMKGAYSSPDNLLMELSQQSLFPDTTYGLDSGGDPERIPDLTFAQFTAFHQRHYHPSNAYAFFYGDDDPAYRLAVLDQYFSEFSRRKPDTSVSLQPPFAKPKRVTRSFAVSGGESEDKGFFTMNFCLGQTVDPDLNLALHALEHILIGLPSSRLRKALTDSGLGEDLAGVGLEADLRQLYFSVGLKGMDPADEKKACKVVLDTLAKMAKGITPEETEAALNTLEFDLRENNTGSYPRGLSLLFTTLSTWLYDGDPLALLPFEKPLAKLRRRLNKGEKVFEDLLKRLFLDNTHRTVVLLTPDQDLADKTRRAEREELAAIRERLDKDALKSIQTAYKELKQFQETPDDPEALAAIPRLRASDMPGHNQRIPLEIYERGESKTLYHELPTNGLVYVDLGFDLRLLPDRLLPYAPVFGRALKEMGTKKEDYGQLLNRIARKTGGIRPQTLALAVRGSDTCASKLFLRGKATQENAPELMGILTEIVFETVFDNKERFQRIVLEAKARAEQHIVPAGHAVVLSRLKAMDPEGKANRAHLVGEQLKGVSQLFFLRRLADRVDKDFDGVLQDLIEIRDSLLCSDSVLINITGEEAGFASILPELSGFHHSVTMPCRPPQERAQLDYRKAEGLTIPAQVNYVGKGVNLARLGVDPGLAANAVAKHLRTGYLWDRVRVQGGAYGAFCYYDRLANQLCLVSYRDPNLDKTLESFDRTASYLEKLKITPDELDKSIVGAIGAMDTYLLPDAKGFTSMLRHITGEDDDYRQEIREAVLSCTQKDFRRFAEAARALARHGHVVVLGLAEHLDESEVEFERLKVL